MNAVKQWLKFARDDIRSAEVLVREGIFNMLCSHAQQAVEKSLKSLLRHHQNRIPYIHILEELCELCIKIEPSFTTYPGYCKELDVFYQPTRYPEALAGSLAEGLPDQQQAEATLEKARTIFGFVQERLGFSASRDTSKK